MPEQDSREVSVGSGARLSFSIAFFLTLIMAAPVLRAPTERLFGSGLVLSRDDPNRDALVVIQQFRTGIVPTPYLQPLTDLPGQALARVAGPVMAYNVLVLITFPLSAASAYLLGRFVLGSHFAAVVAGLIYAFLPLHVLQAGGHPHIAQTQWLPLYFLVLWRCVDQPDLRNAAWLLAGTGAVALSNFYGGFIAAVLSPVALVAYALVAPGRASPGIARRVAITGLVLGGAAAGALVFIHHQAPGILSGPFRASFERTDLFVWSARWWSYLIPPVDHPLFGGAVGEFWDRRGIGANLLEHQQVSVGWSVLLLAAIPIWRWSRGDRSSAAVRFVPVLAGLAGAALLCSLSPERTLGSLTFVRPSAFLYEITPMFRAYARFGVVVGLMVSLLAGAGAAHAARSSSPGLRRATIVLLGLAVIEYAPLPPWRFRDVLPTPAHRWVAEQPARVHVLDCEGSSRFSDALADSFVGDRVSRAGGSDFDDCGEPLLAHKLAAKGFTHAMVRRDSAIGLWLAQGSAFQGLAPVGTFADVDVLAAKADHAGAYVREWRDFYPREYEGARTWRWMKQRGMLRMSAPRDSKMATVKVELRGFPGSRGVEWSVNGVRRGEFEVTSEWRTYELALGPDPGKDPALTLSCLGPAVIANAILGNHDDRALCLALSNLSLPELSNGEGSASRP